MPQYSVWYEGERLDYVMDEWVDEFDNEAAALEAADDEAASEGLDDYDFGAELISES